MLVYLAFSVIFLGLNITLYVLRKRIPDYNKTVLILNGLFLIIVSGLRSMYVGTDAANYGNIFRSFGKASLTADFSNTSIDSFYFYRVICWIVYNLFGGNYQVMLFVSAAIIIYGFFKYLYYYSDNCQASVFYMITLYYFFTFWNITRQGMAIAFFLLAVIEFDKKKYVNFGLLMVMAVLTHNVVIVMAVYFIFKKIKWNKSLFAVYSLALVAATLMIPVLFNLFVRIFPRYSIYSSVLSGNTSSFGGEAQGRKVVLSLAFLVFIIVALILINKNDFDGIKCDKDDISVTRESLWVISAMVMIEIVLGILFSRNTFYLRIQSFFSPLSIVLIPAVAERCMKKWRTIIYIATNAVFLLTLIIRLSGNESEVYPYEFFWQR